MQFTQPKQTARNGKEKEWTTAMPFSRLGVDGHRLARIQKLHIDINVSTMQSKINCRRNPNHGQ